MSRRWLNREISRLGVFTDDPMRSQSVQDAAQLRGEEQKLVRVL
ncbi:hypothetical protein [Thermoleptolyngbya sp. PKUAC-SCTB121]|nr:hypothetical protein [Thermoleptolyngbya sp. PKUAC-SCTB121]